KTALASFDSVEEAGEAVSAVIASGLVPATMEMMDQKIMRIIEDYAHAGLPIRPCVAAAGIPDVSRAPSVDGVVNAGEAGIAVADAIGRALRGAGHGRDLPVPMAHGARLLVFEDRAFALARESQIILLGARDEQAAQRMLWALFVSGPPGATVNVDFLTAGQDWALPVCLAARLMLAPEGPMFAGGEVGSLAPYIPSGAYL
ncbi:MAG: FAD-linked oxidase C-terminal domain-containing protein, partial [Solirubrobacteraceae bacterium]